MTYGEKLSELLVEIEDALWERQSYASDPEHYPDEALRATSKILMSVIMDRMWNMQEHETMDIETRGAMAVEAGTKLRELIKIYTGVDTHELYGINKENER